MATIFSRIISGELPCHRLAENDAFLAFLDIRPISIGHALVIPKREEDRFFDLPEKLLSEILVFAKPIALAIESIIPCNRVGLMVAGLEVPHAHLHLVPIRDINDLSFENASPGKPEQLEALALNIRQVLANGDV